MKKSIYLLLILTFTLAGCTSKENTKKINSFWKQQFVNLLIKKSKMSEAQANMITSMMLGVAQAQIKNKMSLQRNTADANTASPEKSIHNLAHFSSEQIQNQKEQRPSTRTKAPVPVQPSLFEVTVENDDILFARSPASGDDQRFIKKMLDSTRDTNQKTLQDVQNMFGSQVRDQALMIVAKQEKSLQRIAATAPTAQAYATRSNQLTSAMSQELTDLFQKNTKNIKRTR